MSDSSAVLDPDRLPWLADESPLQQRRSRRFALTAFAALAVLLLAGLSFLTGLRGADWLRQQSQSSQESFSARKLTLPSAGQPVSLVQAPAVPADEALDSGPAPLQPTRLPVQSGPAAVPGSNVQTVADAAESASKAAEGECRDAEVGSTCGSADLTALDRHLGLLYSQTWSQADTGRRGLLLRSHDRFVNRLGGCRTSACKSDAYLTRMREIDEIASGQPKAKQALVSSGGLAALDRHLGSLYGQSWERADAGQRGTLLQSQDEFVDKLEACRSNACKAQVYLGRMRQVSEIMSAREQAAIAAKAR